VGNVKWAAGDRILPPPETNKSFRLDIGLGGQSRRIKKTQDAKEKEWESWLPAVNTEIIAEISSEISGVFQHPLKSAEQGELRTLKSVWHIFSGERWRRTERARNWEIGGANRHKMKGGNQQ